MHWCEDIKNMRQMVPQVIFMHIFREHNVMADSLSKEAVNMDMGSALFTKHMDGMVINYGHYMLF